MEMFPQTCRGEPDNGQVFEMKTPPMGYPVCISMQG